MVQQWLKILEGKLLFANDAFSQSLNNILKGCADYLPSISNFFTDDVRINVFGIWITDNKVFCTNFIYKLLSLLIVLWWGLSTLFKRFSRLAHWIICFWSQDLLLSISNLGVFLIDSFIFDNCLSNSSISSFAFVVTFRIFCISFCMILQIVNS